MTESGQPISSTILEIIAKYSQKNDKSFDKKTSSATITEEEEEKEEKSST
jgi:hypothetical protein